MELTVCASADDAHVTSSGWTLRLSGERRAGEQDPPMLAQATAAAAAELKHAFPLWLWRFASDSGLKDLASLPGPLSWWWYAPLSERSPLRSDLIQELYQLLVLRQLIAIQPIDAIAWRGSDRVLAAAAGEVAAMAGIPFRFARVGRNRSRRLQAAVRLLRYFLSHLFQWIVVRIAGMGASVDLGEIDALLYTRFPILWRSGDWAERMFGEWPAFLESKGHQVAYAAVLSSSPLMLLTQWRALKAVVQSRRITLLDRYVTLRQLLVAHLSPRVQLRYLAWRRRSLRGIRFEGLLVDRLLARELDVNALHTELPFSSCIAIGWRTVMARATGVQAVFYPFEYQAMERAVTAGAKSVRDVPVIGVQTGLYTSNQMGFTFPAEEVVRAEEPSGAPLPDVLAAYGELSYKVFASRLGPRRVYLCGGLRYTELLRKRRTIADSTRNHASDAPVSVLVATSAVPEESAQLIAAAIAVAADDPSLHLAFRFHYHLPLRAEVEREAAAHRFDRYSFDETDLNDLLARTDVVICAGTSLGMEAMALGCMPLVFDPLTTLTANPMLDVDEAVFIWHAEAGLREAVAHCSARSSEYGRRRLAWPRALAAHFGDLDADPSQRLYDHLTNRGILASVVAA